jgi:hypothetical protein
MFLGVDGMSSDESDHENMSGMPQFRIVKKPWRNPTLSPWLRVFDSIHRYSRFRPVRRTTRGAQPHIRLLGNKVDDSCPAVIRLPGNAYNSAWLEMLDTYDREILEADEDEIYDFSHLPEVLEYVNLIPLLPFRKLTFLKTCPTAPRMCSCHYLDTTFSSNQIILIKFMSKSSILHRR